MAGQVPPGSDGPGIPREGMNDMMDEADIFEDMGGMEEELANMNADDLARRGRLMDNEIRVLKVRFLSLLYLGRVW